jgi:hypothetical protein
VSAADFGPYGLGDDTTALQAAINATPSGRELTGNGLTYTVTSLFLPSNFSMRDFNLKTKAGSTDFVSPITISGLASPKTNIRLTNIYVDGNRANQTNILGPAEDGGRCGMRILGQVSDLQVIDCTVTNCAGYAFEMFSDWANVVSPPSPITDNTFAFNNILIKNLQSTNNRGCGANFDSFTNLVIEGSNFSNNGQNMAGCSYSASPNYVTTFPWSDGHLGDSTGGVLFSSGINFEGYGEGSGIDGVWLTDCKAMGNVRQGVLFFDGVANPANTNFSPRKNIFINNLQCDAGTISDDGSCLEVTPVSGMQSVPIVCSGGGFSINVTSAPNYPTNPILPGQTLISPGIPPGCTISAYGTGSTTGTGGTGTYWLSQSLAAFTGVSMVVSNWMFQNVNISNLRGTGALILKAVNGFFATGSCSNSGTNTLFDGCVGFCALGFNDGFTAPGANVYQNNSHIYMARFDNPGVSPMAAPSIALGSGTGTSFTQAAVNLFRDFYDGWAEYSVNFSFVPSGGVYWTAVVTPPTGYTFMGWTEVGGFINASGAPIPALGIDSSRVAQFSAATVGLANCYARFLVKHT